MTKTLTFLTPTYKTERVEVPCSVNLTREVKQAMRDWLSGSASWSQRWPTSIGRYVIKTRNPKIIGGSKRVIAKWNKAAKLAFAGPDELHYAAHAARSAGIV